MANVAFKRGLSTALPTAGKAIDGVFYLTTDTNRLYVGNSSSNLVDLNRYIQVVPTKEQLYPSSGVAKGGLAAGDFVWVESGNMLLVCVNPNGNSLTTVWTQINPPDQNDDSDTKVTKLALSDAAADGDKITITLALDQTTVSVAGGKTYTSPAQLTASTDISKADLKAVLQTAVGLDVVGGDNVATLKNSGEGADSTQTVQLKAGSNVTIAVNGDVVTVSAVDTKYDLAANDDSSISLKGGDSSDDKIAFKSGNDALTVASSSANGSVTYTHKAYTTTPGTPVEKEVVHGGTFNIIDGITADKGHVTGYSVKTIKLPEDNNTTYVLDVADVDGEAQAKLQLKGINPDSTDSVIYEAGKDLEVSGDAANSKIVFKHATKTVTPTTSTGSLSHGGTFTVIDSIENDNGHISKINTKTLTLPTDNNTVNESLAVSVGGNEAGSNAAGSIVVTVTDDKGSSVTGRADDVLYHKITIDGTEKTVYNQNNLGSFYSAAKIDEKIHAVNAMIYKGTVSSAADLPEIADKPAIGWTYKVATAGTYGGVSCDVGDLLIANGTETNGVITSNLKWDYVPSGDDTDTQHHVSVVDGSDTADIVLGNNTGAATSKVTVVAGNAINVEGDATNKKITVSHETVSRTDGTNTAVSATHGSSFTVVDEITTTGEGHVTAVKTKSITLPSDNNTTYGVSALTHDNKAKMRLTGYNPDSTDDIVFASGAGLTVTAANDVITYTHETVDTDAENGSAAAQTLSHGGKFTTISDVKVNARGHVTGLITKEFTLPSDNNTTYDLDLQADHKIVLVGSDSSSDLVQLENTDGYIVLTDDLDAQKIALAHKSYTAETLGSATTTASTLAHGGNFTTVVGVTRDSGGHITGVKTRKFTLPGDNNTTYDLTGHTTASKTVTDGTGATISTTLTGSDSSSDVASFDMTSTSLTIAAGTKSVSIDMVWGSF